MRNSHQGLTGLIFGIALVGLIGAVAAQAEGSKETYIAGWAPGNESSRSTT
ncbi:hypothetical protein ACFWAR_19760 [Streptomyces sp. NPDC059917]|uniref:hypothetical protein n=1 Tax=Streptomyces sp. NPDC059917 TaxID=3347002 RepID=UPI00365C9272